jgi:nitrogen fixation protein NifU and related proteins
MENTEKDLRDRLRSIYSDTTIEHVLRPHNTESIPNADGFANCCSGCGEIMKIWLKARDNVIQDAAFWTNGCAATIACGSMCTDLAKGKPAMEALAITSRDIADALVALPEGNLHCAELAAGALRLALKDLLSVQQQPWKKLYRK